MSLGEMPLLPKRKLRSVMSHSATTRAGLAVRGLREEEKTVSDSTRQTGRGDLVVLVGPGLGGQSSVSGRTVWPRANCFIFCKLHRMRENDRDCPFFVGGAWVAFDWVEVL
jgi:hypothetical protein